MDLQEHKKCCKIVDEIMLFFLKRKIKEINIKYKENKTNTVIELEVLNCPYDLALMLESKLAPHHERQYEGFGWELMGDGDFDELEIAGGLIDKLDVSFNDSFVKIIMVRNYE